MTDTNRLLCLVRQAAPAPAVLARAFRLASTFRAELHLMPAVPASGAAPPDEEVLEALGERFVSKEGREEGERIVTVPDVPRSIRDVRDYAAETGVNLVVTDVSPDRDPVPLLDDPPTRDLIEQLPCSALIVGPDARPNSIRRLLVPTDLSDHSRAALRRAVALARPYDASVDVLHVIDTVPYVALTSRDRLSFAPTSLPERQARHRIEDFRREEETTAVSIQTHLAHGKPADEIRRFHEGRDIDLLVLSSHGRRTRPRYPLGQVAERLLRTVTRSLFLVRTFGRSLSLSSPHSESTVPASGEDGNVSS